MDNSFNSQSARNEEEVYTYRLQKIAQDFSLQDQQQPHHKIYKENEPIPFR